MKNKPNLFLSRSIFHIGGALVMSFGCFSAVAQTSGVWTANVPGNWSDPANWQSGVVASGVAAAADFSTLDITADQVVTLDGPVTIGSLLIQDAVTASNNWAFAGAGVLTLNNGASAPVFNVLNRVAVVSAPLAGTNGFIKTGAGLLTLNGNNSGLSGTITLPDVAGTNDAGLVIASDTAIGGVTTINVEGSATTGQYLALDGGVTLGSGVTINLSSPGGNNFPPGGIRSTGANTAVNTISGTINVTSALTRIANNSARRLDIAGPLLGGSNGVVFRFGNNEGIRLMNPANSWTGATNHQEGTLWFEPGALPATSNLSICLSNPGTVQTSGTFNRALGSGAGQVQFTLNATRAQGFGARGGDLTVDFGGAGADVLFDTAAGAASNRIRTSVLVLNGATATHKITLVNPLDINGAARTIQVSAQTAELSGGIKGGTFNLNKTGAGTLILSGPSTWTGQIAMNAGNSGNLGIVRAIHPQAFGAPATVKNVVSSGNNRAVAVYEIAGGITVDENKTLRISGKSYHDTATGVIGEQVSLRNFSGDNTWLGSVIVAETGGAYGIESLSGKLTLGSDPATTKFLRNEAADDIRTLSFFGAGDVVMNLKLATNGLRRFNFQKIGSGTLSITREDNDFDVAPNLRSGVTEVVKLTDTGSPSSLGTANAFNVGGTLRYLGLGDASNRTLGVLQTGATLDSSGAGALQLTGAFSHQTGTGTTIAAPFAMGATQLLVADPSGIAVGQGVTGTNIPAGTTIAAVNVDTRTLTLSQPTTAASVTGVALTLSGANTISRTLTLTGSNAGDNLFAGNLTNPGGTFGVTKAGTGRWSLTGTTKTYTGPTTVQSGTLGFRNAFPAGPVSVAAGATLEIGDLALPPNPNGGLSLDIDGALNLVGPVSVILPQAAPVGTFDVIEAGSITGDGAFVIGGYRGAVGSITGNTGKLTVGAGVALKWTGAQNDSWNLKGDPNWNSPSNAPETFHFGDSVRFDDTTTFTNVLLTGELRPASMVIENAIAPYTFGGTGSLTGPFTLTKSGIGTATLGGGAHTFSGGIAINGGTLLPAGNQSLGGTGQLITIAAGAMLDTNGAMNANRDYRAVIAGNGVDGLGAITNSGAAHNNGFGSITLSGNASIGGVNRWDLRPAAAAGSFAGVLDLAGFTLTKTGSNTIAFVDSVMSGSGNISIDSGMLSFTRMNVSGTGDITVNTGATLQFENYTTGTFDRAITLADGTLRLIGGSFAFGGMVTASGVGIFDVENARTLTVSSGVGGSGGINKIGAGTLQLLGSNTYAGTTTITAGTLQVGSQTENTRLPAGAILNDGQLTINRGDAAYVVANEISGTGSVRIGQTNAGSFDSVVTFTGNNTFTGNVVIESGALRIANPAALGAAPKMIVMTNGTNGRPQLQLDGSAGNVTLPAGYSLRASNTQVSHPAINSLAGDNVIEGVITLVSGGGDSAIGIQSGTLTLSGTVTTELATVRNLILAGQAGTTGRITGTLVNGTGPLGLRKRGENTWILSGENTYTDTTVVEAGTLVINGLQNTATGTVSVNSGATLGGNGTIGGNTTVNAGGILAPGTGVGTFTAVNSVTIAGALAIELDGSAADRLVVGSTLDIRNATLQLSELNPATGSPIILASYGGLTGSQFASVSGLPAGYVLDYNYNSLNQIALVPGSNDYGTWAGSFPGFVDTAEGADPDGDGLSNFQEYAFGLNPTQGTSVSPIVQQLERASGTFRYTRRNPALTGASYAIQTSTTLASGEWTTDAAAQQVVVGNSGDVQTVEVTLTGAPLTAPKWFVRVLATK